MAERERDTTMMSIQCDWEDQIFVLNREVWVSSKLRGEEGCHGKLRGRGGSGDPVSATPDFTVLACAGRTIRVQHTASGVVSCFVAPSRVLSMPAAPARCVDVSEGGLGVSVCGENKITVWDSNAGHPRRTLDGHLGDVYAARLFPSGIVVLSAGADMQLKIWCAQTGKNPVTLTGHTRAVTDVSVVDRGRNVLSVSKDGTCKLWDCGESRCLGDVLQTRLVLNCCDVGPMHRDLKTAPRFAPLTDREIGTEGKLLLVGTEQGSVIVASLHHRAPLFTLDLDSPVNVVLSLSEEVFVAGCQNGLVTMVSVLTQRPTAAYHDSNSAVTAGCVYKSGVLIGRSDGTVSHYDSSRSVSGARLQLTGADCEAITGISALQDTAYTSCRDGKIRKYCLADL